MFLIKIKKSIAHSDFTTRSFSSNKNSEKRKYGNDWPTLFRLLKKRDFKKGRNNNEDSLSHTGTLTGKNIYYNNILP